MMMFSNYLLAVLALMVSSVAQAGWAGYGSQYGYGQQQQSAQTYNRSGDSYGRAGETLKGGTVTDAIVISVRKVTMEASGTATTVGAGAGAAVGGVAGASVGKTTTTKTLGGLIGAIGGGVLGDMAGTTFGEDEAGEVVVMLQDGSKIFIVQKDGMQFKEGQRVFILASGGDISGRNANLRVAPNPAAK